MWGGHRIDKDEAKDRTDVDNRHRQQKPDDEQSDDDRDESPEMVGEPDEPVAQALQGLGLEAAGPPGSAASLGRQVPGHPQVEVAAPLSADARAWR